MDPTLYPLLTAILAAPTPHTGGGTLIISKDEMISRRRTAILRVDITIDPAKLAAKLAVSIDPEDAKWSPEGSITDPAAIAVNLKKIQTEAEQAIKADADAELRSATSSNPISLYGDGTIDLATRDGEFEFLQIKINGQVAHSGMNIEDFPRINWDLEQASTGDLEDPHYNSPPTFYYPQPPRPKGKKS